ncbi:hypothetical protein [Roseibium limicola]|uniref:Uncharacterized protein n=1 Tax=Roseibium limicola TaxID=2816037 RepID=A0A939ERB6_9HYPH|nr:hypothetical protein [Roseibium limicola]MBO0346113.1 hypothetical protein [Roseibium limicola]
MLNRIFALAIMTSVLGTPFLILLAQKMDGPATASMSLRTYERCETGSHICQIGEAILQSVV